MSLKKTGCLFCEEHSNDDLKTGKLYVYENIAVHYYCLLFSSGLEQKGRPDEDGIVGFLPKDIFHEAQRGKRLKCSFCKKKGATVGCCSMRCRKVFHLPCGQQRDSLHQFFGSFRSFCSEHRPMQKISYGEIESIDQCLICFGKIDYLHIHNILFPMCCRNGVFHRLCVQKQAISSGCFFFRCPLCNNKEQFQEEMLHYGIYIPEQDAAWERENNAFQDLYVRHSRCDVQRCSCPQGRTHNAEDGCWQIVLCTVCGSQGCHIKCGNVAGNLLYECSDCSAFSEKVKKKSCGEEIQCLTKKLFEEEEDESSTKMSLQQFLGGNYAFCKTSLIYIDSDEESSDGEKRFPAEQLPEEDESQRSLIHASDESEDVSKEVAKKSIFKKRISSLMLHTEQSECGPSNSSVFKKGPNTKRSKARFVFDETQMSILNFFTREQQKMCVMTFKDDSRPSLRQLDD